MRVAVTGAAGYAGRAIVRALRSRGHDVAALVRGATTPDAGVRVVTGDLRDPAALRALVEGVDAVVHAAAYVHRRAETARDRAECFAVNVGGTSALIEAMRAGGRKPHLVFIGSTAVYGAGTRNASESAPIAPVTTYGTSKAKAERAVLGAASGGGITACVLRPSFVYGPGAPGNFARLESLVRRGALPLVNGGANEKSLVHVDDLALAAAIAAERAAATNGRVYNVAGPVLSVRAMAEAVARGAGVPLRTIPVPAPLFALSAATLTALSRVSGGAIPDLGRSLEVFAGTDTVDAGAIARDLGVTFRDPAAAYADAVRAAAAR